MALLYEKVVQEDLNIGTDDGVSVTSPEGGTLSGTQIGIHSFGVGQITQRVVWDPSSIAAAGYEAKNVTVPGAVAGDFVMLSLSTILTNGMILSGHVSANDTVKAILFNPGDSPVDVASGILTVIVFKSR